MSEAIVLSWVFTIPALIFVLKMMHGLWRKPRWGAYFGGVGLLALAFAVCFVFTSSIYQTGARPMVLALLSFGGWLMMMTGAYVVVGLIVVLMRRERAS